jgi:hypothetical protein
VSACDDAIKSISNRALHRWVTSAILTGAIGMQARQPCMEKTLLETGACRSNHQACFDAEPYLFIMPCVARRPLWTWKSYCLGQSSRTVLSDMNRVSEVWHEVHAHQGDLQPMVVDSIWDIIQQYKQQVKYCCC